MIKNKCELDGEIPLKQDVKIGDKKIGSGHPTYIIAEIGANHNRNLDIAKELIKKAAEAGVDAVKFQTYKAETLYSKKAPKFSKDPMKPFDLIKSIELPPEWQHELFIYATKKKVHFLSSPFDNEAVDLLDNLGVPAFKIASPEIVDLDLIRYTAKKKKPMLVSTGMANLGEIEDAVNTIRSVGNNKIVLLHCSTLYPTPVEVVNLNAIKTLKNAFKLPVGFSDHTMGLHITIAAVAKGANVVEKHFSLDRRMKGPDHHFAIEPSELSQLVRCIRDVEAAMGTGIKERSELENQEAYVKARRSIHARVDIPKGRKITRAMLITKRPAYGIQPKFIDLVVGREAKQEIKKDEWITWEMI